MALTIKEVRNWLKQHGKIPSKGRGQNFLLDPNLPDKIIQNLLSNEELIVLEIGPGLGALTLPLAKMCDFFVALEIDISLLEYLQQQIGPQPNVHLLKGDATDENDLKKALSLFADYPGRIQLVGNLPYALSTAILSKLMPLGCLSRGVILLQKEMAERLMAAPGNRERGYFTVWSENYANFNKLINVGPRAFYPAPKVDSVLLEIEFHEPRITDEELWEGFVQMIKAAFLQKRKKLRNALKLFIKEKAPLREKHIIGEYDILEKRAEQLSFEEFLSLYNLIINTGI